MADSVPTTTAATVPSVDPAVGLDDAAVAARVREGAVNVVEAEASRSVASILRANLFTRFNAILGAMFVLIVVFGELRDALFGIVLVVNTVVGVVQELRAKKTLDSLQTLAAPKARAVRNGALGEVALDMIVRDDVLELAPGDQIPVDGRVLTAAALEVDESLLTGEADPVLKHPGDAVLSGSFVVAGSGRIQATAVGADAYANKLAAEARKFTLSSSELRNGINQILRYVTFLIVPAGLVLFFTQFTLHRGVPVGHGADAAAAAGASTSFGEAVAAAVAGVVGLVPEGLVLLTSVAFAAAVVRLGRKGVLVQEMPAVEVLARVDVVCLDKTGTLTQGDLALDRVDCADESERSEVTAALGALSAAEPNPNASLRAIAAEYGPPPDHWAATEVSPFTSARKWSGASFAEGGTWLLGAPDILLDPTTDVALAAAADDLARGGTRVLALCATPQPLPAAGTTAPPAERRGAALVVLRDQVRPDAPATLAFFAEQGVGLRVISGDNPETVGAIAAAVGVPGADHPTDARSLGDTAEALADVVEDTTVYGRVTPVQKRAMVGALQGHGHVVAMTGDGVNDVLALKDADIGIAMGNGAGATRAVAQLVLLQNEFSELPSVVAEGRRVIANIVRVANLFLTKTVYVAWLILATAVFQVPFPFLPRHLTVIGSLTIGIPGFFLALAPNTTRDRAGFVQRVLRFTIPVGTICALASWIGYAAVGLAGAGLEEARASATIVMTLCGLWVLGIWCRPFTAFRVALLLSMVACLAAVLWIPPVSNFYALPAPPPAFWLEILGVAAIASAAIETYWRLARRWIDA